MEPSVRNVELLRVRVPLVAPFRTARGVTRTKEALLVRVDVDGMIGWGECVAERAPTYAADTIDGARLALRDHLLPRVFAGASCDDVRGHAAARAALQCALLDARLRAEGVSLSAHLGGTRAFIDAGVAIGLHDDLDELRSVVRRCVEQGYRRIKCKIEPGNDVRVVRAARAAAGDDIALAADANGSYSLDATGALFAALDDLGVQCVEQPLPPDALVDHATLARERPGTSICLDESITSATVARDAIALHACDAISVKAGRVGGLAEARDVHDVCYAAGIAVLAGGMLETGIGRAALLALASLPGFTWPGDCSASDRYFGPDGDLTEPFVLDGGRLRVPDAPGLGVDPRPESLARATIARERITAS